MWEYLNNLRNKANRLHQKRIIDNLKLKKESEAIILLNSKGYKIIKK